MAAPDHITRFLRFALVGGGFSLGYALVTTGLINFANAPPLATSVIVYIICIPLAFLAQRQFAFRGRQSNGLGALIYAATQIVCLAFVATIASQFVTYVFWIDTLIYLAAAGSAAVASYVICNYLIFRSMKG